MGNCWICQRGDGWNHQVIAANGVSHTLCLICHKGGCDNCGEQFDGRKHQAHEVVFTDQNGHKTENEVWCHVCTKNRKGGERV